MYKTMRSSAPRLPKFHGIVYILEAVDFQGGEVLLVFAFMPFAYRMEICFRG
jgi:hypothetical protein